MGPVSDNAWTRDRIIAATRDVLVSCRDALGDPLDLPTWLAPWVEPYQPPIMEFLDAVHPEDHLTVVELYRRALEDPEADVCREIRSNVFGDTARIELRVINLTDDPNVGGLLATLRHIATIDGDHVASDHVFHNRPRAWMVMTLDETAIIRSVQGECETLLGYRADELLGRIPAEFNTGETLAAGIQMFRALRDHPEVTQTARREWRRKDGTTVWIETSYINRIHPPPGEGNFLMVMWDITEELQAESDLATREAELRQMADDFRTLADEVPVAVFRCDRRGMVRFHNAAWRRVLDTRSDVERIHDLLDVADHRLLDGALASAADSRERQEVELAGDDGTTWRLGIRRTSDDGDVGFIGSLEDVTATVELRRAATRDPLTELLNRPAMERRIAEATATRPDSTLVLFVDLDRFKSVNDTLGHAAGDAVIVEVAGRLRTAARAGDAVGRWGGDEFVLLLDVAAGVSPDAVADRMRATIDGPVALGESEWHITASVGAVVPEPGEDPESVVGRADRAMFEQKRTRV